MAALVILIGILPITANATESDLAAYWSFDENTGNTITDLSGNGRELTVFGQAKWTEGKVNKAFDLNGTTVLTMSGSKQIKAYNLTVSMFVKITDFITSDNGANILFCNEAESALGQGSVDLGFYEKQLYSYVCGTKWDIGDRVASSIDGNTLKGTWHHIAVVYNQDYTADTGMAFLYIDGKEVAKTELTVTIGGNYYLGYPKTAAYTKYNFVVGGYKQGTDVKRGTTGAIDEMKIFTKALSAKEILDISKAGNTSTATPKPSSPKPTPAETPAGSETAKVTPAETPTGSKTAKVTSSETPADSQTTNAGSSTDSSTTATNPATSNNTTTDLDAFGQNSTNESTTSSDLSSQEKNESTEALSSNINEAASTPKTYLKLIYIFGGIAAVLALGGAFAVYYFRNVKRKG